MKPRRTYIDDQDREADTRLLPYARECQWNPDTDAKRVTRRIWLTPIVVIVVIAAMMAAFTMLSWGDQPKRRLIDDRGAPPASTHSHAARRF